MNNTYELWQEPEGDYSFFPSTSSRAKALLDPAATLIKTFEAVNWEQACQLQNDFLGWGVYKPMAPTDLHSASPSLEQSA